MQTMTTGEVAALIDISKRTLQNWLRHQKIEAPQKGPNGYYNWTPEDIRRAREYSVNLKGQTKYSFRAKYAKS